MTLPAPRVPFALDPLIAEAKRRARQRRVLVGLSFAVGAAATAGFVLGSWDGGAGTARSARPETVSFAVKSVNAGRLVAGTYVTIVSPVKLSRHVLARTPLFDITGQFSLVARAHGPMICSFTRKIERSVTFPNANGKTLRVEVYASKAPGRIPRVCHAFQTFSLSYLRQPPLPVVGSGLHGIAAAQHPRTGADRLDPSVLLHDVGMRLKPRSSRLLRQFPNGERVYGVATTDGSACAVVEPASALGCSRLTREVPTTIASFEADPESPAVSFGIALDGVTAVSWSAGRQGLITVPVRHNAWVHLGNASFEHFTVHFADGRTQTIHS